MRESLLDVLRCPRCHGDRTLSVDVGRTDEREVRDGVLRCGRCELERPVHDGIADLLHDPPDHVVRETAGLERFAVRMRADGWDRELIRRLPEIDEPYWIGQARAMHRLVADVPLRAGARLLDVGSNTCWASNVFARRGLEVVAVDIAATELQGLKTADYFIDGEIFFERVLSTMFELALADESFDYVFCCEVLHHNDRGGLDRTLAELYRVLKPSGLLLVINEPLRFPLRLKRDHGHEVAEFDGYEHVYFMHEYLRAARAAGFRITLPVVNEALARPGLAGRARGLARFAWSHGIGGDASLSLVGTKPA
jgi:SAM-dependent methyltransferase